MPLLLMFDDALYLGELPCSRPRPGTTRHWFEDGEERCRCGAVMVYQAGGMTMLMAIPSPFVSGALVDRTGADARGGHE